MSIKNFIATNTVHEEIDEIKKLKEEIKCLQEREQYLKYKIANEIEDCDAICNEEGTLIATYKHSHRLVFDMQAFKKANPEIYEDFCKEVTTRTFLLKD